MAGRSSGKRRSRSDGARVTGLALAGVAALALAGCSPQVRHHGYVPDDRALQALEVGRATRAQVAETVGRPGATGVLDDRTWIYVASRWEQRAPRPAMEVDREVLAISFDGRGVVSNIERFGLQDGEVVTLSRRVTEQTVRGQGLLAQILRNVGRFSAEDLID